MQGNGQLPVSNSRCVLLTGGTGGLGRVLLSALLHHSECKLFVLARSKNGAGPLARVEAVLEHMGVEAAARERVEVLEGDVSEPGLGLEARDLRRLCEQVDEVYHLAALTALNGSHEDLRQANVKGVRNMLALAREIGGARTLRRFHHFSTAFVAGSSRDTHAVEDGMVPDPEFSNHYERTKYEGEQHVRGALAEGLPVTIYRPSIVVGDSQTGRAGAFNVIYPFVKLFSRGLMPVLLARPGSTINIVPVDFVVRATLAIASRPDSLGKTYHLVTSTPPTIDLLLQLQRTYLPGIPPTELVAPEEFDPDSVPPSTQAALEMIEPHMGYLVHKLSFDTTNTEQALKDTPLAMPDTGRSFLLRILLYTVRAGYLVLDQAPAADQRPEL